MLTHCQHKIAFVSFFYCSHDVNSCNVAADEQAEKPIKGMPRGHREESILAGARTPHEPRLRVARVVRQGPAEH